MKTILQQLEKGQISSERAEIQINDIEPSWVKALSTAIGLTSFFLVISFIIAASLLPVPFKIVFTYDYLDQKRTQTELKIIACKDSSMKYVNEPEKYNRYLDSANKYVEFYNYLKP